MEDSRTLVGCHFAGERHDRVLAVCLSSPSNRSSTAHQRPKTDGFHTSGVSHEREGEAVRTTPLLPVQEHGVQK